MDSRRIAFQRDAANSSNPYARPDGARLGLEFFNRLWLRSMFRSIRRAIVHPRAKGGLFAVVIGARPAPVSSSFIRAELRLARDDMFIEPGIGDLVELQRATSGKCDVESVWARFAVGSAVINSALRSC